MAADPLTLNLAANALGVVVLVRIATWRVTLDLWAFSLYALPACALAFVALVVWVDGFEVGVFLFGVAALSGVYWTASTRPHARLGLRRHLRAAAGSVALAGALAFVAAAYRWWLAFALVAASVLVLALAAGAAPLRPGLEFPRRPDEFARAASALPRPVAMARATPEERPVHAGPAPAPAVVAIACPACGLAGNVPASRAGQRLACPRCKAPVAVPGGPPKAGRAGTAPRPAAKAGQAAPAPRRKA